MAVPALIAATVVSAAGSIQQGNAAAASYNSQAAASDYNAAINTQNADAAGKEGTQRELMTRTQQALQMGEARAAAGEAGIGGAQGSSLGTALEQDSVNAELNALGVRYERDTQRNAYLEQSAMNTYDAGVARMNAKSAKKSGYMGALSSVFNGANRYYAQQQAISSASPPSSAGRVVGQSYSTPMPSGGYYQFSSSINNPYKLTGF